MKKVSMKKIIGFATAALIFFGLSAYPNSAQGNPGWGNNIIVYDGLIANFKYEKTIDMTNAKDRNKIPNADFNFVISTIDESEYSLYQIDKTYDTDGSWDYISPVHIYPGKLMNGEKSMPFSTVSFRETDGYDGELTRLMDSHDSIALIFDLDKEDAHDNSEAIINHILKYDWGEMRSSDHIQTAIARQPVMEEKDLWDGSENVESWPKDTILWRCFHEYRDEYFENYLNEADPLKRPGSFEDGCEFVNNQHNFDSFNYVTTYNLRMNFLNIYSAFTYRRPLLTHQTKDTAGNYTSVSKGILKPEEYYKWSKDLRNYNPGNWGINSVYRFILTEEVTDNSAYIQNDEKKVLDFLPGSDDMILMFNTIEEADAFYTYVSEKAFTDEDDRTSSIEHLEKDYFPNASFTNRPTPAPKPEPSPDPDPTPEPNEPPKHDLRYARDDFYEEKKPEVIIIHKESILPKTGDSLNLPLYVGALGFLLLSAGVLKLRRNN